MDTTSLKFLYSTHPPWCPRHNGWRVWDKFSALGYNISAKQPIFVGELGWFYYLKTTDRHAIMQRSCAYRAMAVVRCLARIILDHAAGRQFQSDGLHSRRAITRAAPPRIFSRLENCCRLHLLPSQLHRDGAVQFSQNHPLLPHRALKSYIRAASAPRTVR